MKIISIANRKGGVGKTVLSANIAYELSRLGYLVIMVDLDPQSDLTKIYSASVQDASGTTGTIFDLLCKRKAVKVLSGHSSRSRGRGAQRQCRFPAFHSAVSPFAARRTSISRTIAS